MEHRILVLRTGCAGVLSRRPHLRDVAVTVVDAETDDVERIRLHRPASGQNPKRRPL